MEPPAVSTSVLSSSGPRMRRRARLIEIASASRVDLRARGIFGAVLSVIGEPILVPLSVENEWGPIGRGNFRNAGTRRWVFLAITHF